MQRASSRLAEDGPYALALVARLKSYTTDDEATLLLYRMMFCLKNEIDRQLLNLLLRGAGHRAIGSMLGITEENSRPAVEGDPRVPDGSAVFGGHIRWIGPTCWRACWLTRR